MAKKQIQTAASKGAAVSKAGATPADKKAVTDANTSAGLEEEVVIVPEKEITVKEKPLTSAEREELKKLRKQNAELQALVPEETPSFEVEDDEDENIVGGTYEAAAPAFTWDDNSVIDTNELIKGTKSKDKKTAEKAITILASLVQRKSGILRRKED